MSKDIIIGGIVVLLIIGGVWYGTRMSRTDEPTDGVTEISGENAEGPITPISKTVKATFVTSMGNIEMELYGEDAPLTVGNFFQLTTADFYDGTSFHRVIPDFMIQGGDPNSRNTEARFTHGTGGSGYQFKDEINSRKLVRGSLAMANSGPDTNSSQFFIVTAQETPWLDGRHTNFGMVTSGMDIVDAIVRVETDERDNPLEPVILEDVIIEQ